jgi:hypothetical protein
MSFRGGNSQRWGHVPPAQYGPPGGTQDSNYNPGLHRQSSFDNGDDASFFDSNGNRYQGSGPPPVPGRTANMPQEELFMGGTASQSPRSPGQSTFANSAMSGYQHQYQPFPGAPQSPQVPYNPLNFARTQSQSQASQYRPQPAYNTASPATTSHQPYNPALYQGTQAASQLARQGTVSGYNTYQTSYNSPPLSQVPASPTYWPSPSNVQQQHYPPPVPSRPYEQPLASPTHNTSNSAPLPPRQPLYNPPTAVPTQYPSNGNNYGQSEHRPTTSNQASYPNYGSYSGSQSQSAYNEDPNSYGNRIKPSSSHSNTGSSIPPLSQQGSPSGSGLQRHPTLRPLPSAPVDSDPGDNDDWGLRDTEDVSQEQLFADIGDALGTSNSRRGRPHGIDQRNGDLLDSELQDLHRYDSRATTIGASGVDRYASNASTLNNHDTNYTRFVDDDDEDSDPEAAAGIEAMRLADLAEQDQMGGPLSFGTYGPQAVHNQSLSQDESSDSDYKHMDLGLVGGGYDAHMSYGDDLVGAHTGHSSEMDDQSRPLPTPQEIGRSDSYSRNTTAAGLGGMTNYAIPGAGDIHPFPAFESARVDTFGTGGLQRPTSQSHRLSFDEGDEHVLLHSRLSESRQSGRSGSDSPSRDEMPELFYHPGMGSSPYNRPLPAVPPLSENRTPQLLPAGSYRSGHQYTHSYSSSTEGRPYQPPSGPDAYPSQSMLTPGGQYVPRSSSLSSHSSTPQTVPPVRSKTDAEERQARQKAARLAGRPLSSLDGYDVGATPQSSMTLDLPALPAGRRKKFSPSRLSTTDYAKCREPWALSGIADWIREMAGGETGEGESDLRQKTIEDGLVALFTHKVPTMNTADAETLSQRVVKSMFDADILLPEEEWVKFGGGDISGVLWQLTGSGCYAPKVHEQEIHGRCYSHHCTRTLKKINLQTHVLEPSRKSEDWVTFFKLTKEGLEGTTKKEIERQNNLHEIVMSEDIYMDQINVLRVLYRDDLASWQPPIIGKNKVAKFISSVFGKIEAIKEVNENYLLAQLKYRQKEQGPWIIGFSDIFREWIRKARSAYVEYASGFPYAVHLVRKEADRNLLFRQFLDQARDNKLSGRLDWNTYLKAPITRLQRYTLLLGTVLKNMTQDTEEKVILATAIEEIKAVTLECDAKVDEQSKKVELIELQSKLYLRPGMERVELNLDHLGRELIFKGDLQRAGANRFAWLETHAILFDHYLVLAKTVAKADTAAGRKKEVYDVSKLVSWLLSLFRLLMLINHSQFQCNFLFLRVQTMTQLSNHPSKVSALSQQSRRLPRLLILGSIV